MNIRVYYEDTDAGGVVYHSNYLNFCERARSDAFYSAGINPMLNDGHFVVRKIDADFISSAKLGDLLDIRSVIVKTNGASLFLRQEIFKEDKKIFELMVMLVFVDHAFKVKKITQSIKELLYGLYGENLDRDGCISSIG